MLPSSFLVFTASLLLPLVAASLAPVCVPSIDGYQVETLTTLYKTFCGDLSKHNFTSYREVYGVPVISLSFIPAISEDGCDEASCISTFGTLIESCEMNSHSIFGTGSIDSGCGTYNFTVWNTTLNPVGTATETLGVGSATGTPVLLSLTSSTQASSSLSTSKPIATKPSVGSTALGTSGAGFIEGSGYTLIAVAIYFAWFL